MLQSGGNQRAGEPTPGVAFHIRKPGVLWQHLLLSRFHTEDDYTEFLKASVALLTSAFLIPLMKEMSWGPHPEKSQGWGLSSYLY